MPPAPPATRSPLWSTIGLGLVALLTAGLAAHRLHFAWHGTPNILFWDQWDLYDPLFKDAGWWTLFTHQHGPHRQGLGFLFTAAIAQATHWDVRIDAVITVVATVAAAVAALPLARRCGARSGLILATVPLLFLTLRQFESWIGPANPSHGAFPILLTVLFGLSWFIASQPWRLGAQVALTLGLVFTGFGLFAGALAPVLLGLEAWRHWRHGARRPALLAAAACLLTVAIWVVFFAGYRNQPAVEGLKFPHERPLEYVGFSALMFASYLGWHGHGWLDVAGGLALMTLLTVVAAVHGWRVLRSSPAAEPASTVLFILAAATLLYCWNTAVGRVVLGWREAPYAPRYVTLLAPGFLALFLQAERCNPRWLRAGCWVALLALSVATGLTLNRGDREAADWYRRGRAHWREVYLRTGSQHEANVATSPDQGFTIHPGDLTAKLEFLRKRQLNLFKAEEP